MRNRYVKSLKVRQFGEWSKGTVADILSNETYAGVWHYSKKKSPPDQWLAVEVPAIVDRELWEKAQEQRGRNREMSSRNTKYEYLFGRRVICGQCSYKMYGRTVRRGKYLYYVCPAADARGGTPRQCNNGRFRVDQVDSTVWGWVKGWLSNPEALREGLEAQRAEQERANKPLYDRLAVTDDLLSENRRQLEKLLDLYLSGDFDKTMLTDRKTRLETTIAVLEKERADLAVFLESQLSDETIATLTDFAREVSAGLELAEENFVAKRQIIDLLDVWVTLTIEDGQKIAYVRCLVDETSLLIASANSRRDSPANGSP